jgi:hypothetical protein
MPVVEKALTVDVANVDVVLKDVALPMGLVVNAITIHGKGVHVAKEPFKFELSEPGTIEALLLAPNLASFLNKESPGGLRDFKVELRDGKIFVKASLMIMKADAVCTLRIVDGSALYVDLESVDVMGVGAKNMVQSQLDKINPLLDANDLPIKVVLTDHSIADGKLTLKGTVEPPSNN